MLVEALMPHENEEGHAIPHLSLLVLEVRVVAHERNPLCQVHLAAL